jgi:hypothetical protein
MPCRAIASAVFLPNPRLAPVINPIFAVMFNLLL